ncbi:MAG: copper amine oxidase N-terminal domain-containing protein, partial [Clostridia bacterium]|nr:copper amine oxidase N-terminal domain-containing protein [Clostridia bacterium]
MKKIIICLMLVISLMMMATSFAASVNVQINGEMIDFTDANGNKVEAQTINSRTMVPLRKIFEVLNCDIDWDGTTKTVTAKQKDKTIILQIDNKIATIKDKTLNKEEEITLDSEPIIFENRTLVPLRFIGESLGKTVAWDAGNKTAIIIDYDELAKII